MKDLGKKGFMFSKIEEEFIQNRLLEEFNRFGNENLFRVEHQGDILAKYRYRFNFGFSSASGL